MFAFQVTDFVEVIAFTNSLSSFIGRPATRPSTAGIARDGPSTPDGARKRPRPTSSPRTSAPSAPLCDLAPCVWSPGQGLTSSAFSLLYYSALFQ